MKRKEINDYVYQWLERHQGNAVDKSDPDWKHFYGLLCDLCTDFQEEVNKRKVDVDLNENFLKNTLSNESRIRPV